MTSSVLFWPNNLVPRVLSLPRESTHFLPTSSQPGWITSTHVPDLMVCAAAKSLGTITSKKLALPKFNRELVRVSNFNWSINWHYHMKDHVEIGHLTEYDAFMVNRDQVMNLKIWFKIHANVFNFEKRPPKPYKLLKFSYQFCDNCKILSSTF